MLIANIELTFITTTTTATTRITTNTTSTTANSSKTLAIANTKKTKHFANFTTPYQPKVVVDSSTMMTIVMVKAATCYLKLAIV